MLYQLARTGCSSLSNVFRLGSVYARRKVYLVLPYGIYAGNHEHIFHRVIARCSVDCYRHSVVVYYRIQIFAPVHNKLIQIENWILI